MLYETAQKLCAALQAAGFDSAEVVSGTDTMVLGYGVCIVRGNGDGIRVDSDSVTLS